ncbi:riboflavin synthase [Consotaella salsifontis]|uniref:Riboflavin synthase n=1 Tax=Consotaella salsifontis TaxID=1365950 RepID=A0A1T4P437_9HYPH|nr:riboflavin synthase [Consotaella salsifontis]SJZ86219.1 riboflavin synthase alpha chain [Consotaella salsifontis]
MFSGIVTDIGTVEQVTPLAEGRRFRVMTNYDPATIEIGASIAHAGVCLTVTALCEPGSNQHWYEVEAWEEALRLTTLGQLATGGRVNLERSLKMGDEIGGHLVSGHIDGKAEIVGRAEEGEAVRFTIKVPDDLKHYVARKGSVALDGTSLTVNGVDDDTFDVLIIRHTLAVTTWGEREVGDELNLEVDQIARYAERLFGTAVRQS